MTAQDSTQNIDPTLYPDRWIALVRGRVVGVGLTRQQAQRAARQTRPKDTPQLLFVHADGHIDPVGPEESLTWGDGVELKVEPNWRSRQPLLPEVIAVLQAQQIEAYLVGGAVRDLLLGKETVVDLDWVVIGDGLAVARTVANTLKAAYYPLDEARGTGRVVTSVADKKTYLDFAACRGSTLLADLQDRDFTINAIALSLSDPPQLIDPLQGRLDLARRRIRAVSPAAFEHDPVRVVRAIRQAQELGFEIEPHTAAYLREGAAALPSVSPERRRDELLKLLNSPAPGRAGQELRRLEVLPHLLPDIQATVGVAQAPPHFLNVFDHTTAALEAWADLLRAGLPDIPPQFRDRVSNYLNEPLAGELTPQQLLPLALLWHDAGKPHTRAEAGGRVRFLGHERVSAELARQAMTRLHFSNQAINFVGRVVTHHMRPLHLAAGRGQVSRRAIYRFFRDADEKPLRAGVAVALHALADQRATYPAGEGQAEAEALRQVVAQLLAAFFEQPGEVIDPPPLLSGHDLIETFSLPAGPLIGHLLNRLKEAQATGQVVDRAAAVTFIKNDLEFVDYHNHD
ncbi:MAG: HD domain-containing protein [Chloroflexota bacterium]